MDFEKLWEQIEENFDWDSVYKTMKMLDWGWDIDGKMVIPQQDAIIQTARMLTHEAYKDKRQHATGGFYASCDENGLSLSFILTEWFADND